MKQIEKQKVLDWIELNYDGYEVHIVREDYDTIVIYLHDRDHSFLNSCKIVYYNMNYSGEFNVSRLESI